MTDNPQTNWMLRACRAKAPDLPEEWRWYRWQRLKGSDETFIVSGGIARPIKRGKRKGQPTWRDNVGERQFAVTMQEINDQQARYERETGNCSECEGTGKRVVGWGLDTGTRYADCKHCGATGKARKERGKQ